MCCVATTCAKMGCFATTCAKMCCVATTCAKMCFVVNHTCYSVLWCQPHLPQYAELHAHVPHVLCCQALVPQCAVVSSTCVTLCCVDKHSCHSVLSFWNLVPQCDAMSSTLSTVCCVVKHTCHRVLHCPALSTRVTVCCVITVCCVVAPYFVLLIVKLLSVFIALVTAHFYVVVFGKF